MKKQLYVVLITLGVFLASVAGATFVGDFLKAGISVTGDELIFNKSAEFDESVTFDNTVTYNSAVTNDAAVTHNDSVTYTDVVSYNSVSVNATGPTDDVDVSSANIVQIDTSSNNCTIGGFTGGVDGQTLFVVVTDATNDAVLEHNEAGGDQDIFLNNGSDDTLSSAYGGWTLICDGDDWFEVGN